MIERVIEDWLDKATERTFQIPVCHMLRAEGFTVVHMSRHCGEELGKDIIAIDAEGRPCGFQLKGTDGGKITLSQWRQMSGQIIDLLNLQIVHPSLTERRTHRSFLVTNRELDEQVSQTINHLNRARPRQSRLEVWTRGDLIGKACKLGPGLWPSELEDTKTFLELFLTDATSSVAREKLASLFCKILSLSADAPPEHSKRQRVRTIASCGLLCASATATYTNAGNYWAEIQAWTIYLAHAFAYAERCKIEWEDIGNTAEIALQIIHNRLACLCEELQARKHYHEGGEPAEWLAPNNEIYRARLTLLLGLTSVYGLWRRFTDRPRDATDDFIRAFCLNERRHLLLWGEAAIPQFLAFHWYWKTQDGGREPDDLLAHLIKGIADVNDPRGNRGLATPYYTEEDVLPRTLCQSLLESGYFAASQLQALIGGDDDTDDFRGASYGLEGLVHLYVRRNWKQTMKALWEAVSRIDLCSFVPRQTWQYYLWCSDEGKNITRVQQMERHWNDLQRESTESRGTMLPEFIKRFPPFFVLLLIVYPHRLRADAMRWLDTNITRVE